VNDLFEGKEWEDGCIKITFGQEASEFIYIYILLTHLGQRVANGSISKRYSIKWKTK